MLSETLPKTKEAPTDILLGDPSQTPMMRQYLDIKGQYADSILFYRIGDFYEMFYDDAVKASKILNLTLTSRNKSQEDAVPLCGVPHHSAQTYINKLLASGHKVAICEQVEDPKKAKGLVKRDVISVLTPGLVINPDCLDAKISNYIVAVARGDDAWGLAKADISTGSFSVTEIYDEKKCLDEILKIDAREIIVSEEMKTTGLITSLQSQRPELRINFSPKWYVDADLARENVKNYFQASPQSLGLKNASTSLVAVSCVLTYLRDSKSLKEGVLSKPSLYFTYDSMALDESAQKNLELFKTLSDQKVYGSLVWLMDQAQTPMGSRLVREWLRYPLVEKTKIDARLDSVEELFSTRETLLKIREVLSQISDLERIQNRVLYQQGNAVDLLALGQSLAKIPELKEVASVLSRGLFGEIKNGLNDISDLRNLIEKNIVDNPPMALKEGGLIREGVNATLDELREIEKNGKFIISTMEARERSETGISSLKIRYNQVFGYYIEITNTHKDKAPAHYIRKQTLSTAERYITPDLKEYENKVLGAAEKIRELEYQLFVSLRDEVARFTPGIKELCQAIATLDVLATFAFLAGENNYVRPQIFENGILKIALGRHPLVEVLARREAFVPNDVYLESDTANLMMITGPNMAGKSTVMRQTALIVIMAQMGSFVPARSAEVGLVDRVFTRIGASDHLQKGQSTFMVEMLETAHILSQATPKSLVILDEIGRGTSTFDGLSIAWAVAENIHDKIKCRTLFATHYHELTDLASDRAGIKNYHMAVIENHGEIRFLRELKSGGTNRSYGVHVAAMAGLPDTVIRRSREILKLLEMKDLQFSAEATGTASYQPSLFDVPKTSAVEEEMKKLDINSLTPLMALNLINDWIRKIS